MDYGYGDEIPTKGISQERIAQLRKRGKIGEVPVAGPNPEIFKLTREITELKDRNEDLLEGGKVLAKKNQELLACNRKLEEENQKLLANVPAPENAEPLGAGPINAKPKGGKDK